MSDIHGHYAKYRAMFAEIHFSSADTLYILGDVIGRGPDGVKILQDILLRWVMIETAKLTPFTRGK